MIVILYLGIAGALAIPWPDDMFQGYGPPDPEYEKNYELQERRRVTSSHMQQTNEELRKKREETKKKTKKTKKAEKVKGGE